MGSQRRFAALAALAPALALVLVGGSSLAGPAPDSKGSSSPSQGADENGSDRTVDTSGVASDQRRLESSMATLGGMAQSAKQDGDAVLAACLEDKVTRGRDVMDVATGELMVIRDQNSSAQQKSFAAEKLGAAADRMDGIVASAKGCSGDQSLEQEDDVARNELDKTEQIPLEDPTIAPTESPVPPAVDQGQPPTVASPTR